MRALKTWRPTRRQIGVVAGAVVVAIALTPFLFLPALVRGRVTSIVEDRLGLETKLDGVGLSLRGVDLKGLHLAGENSDDLSIDIEHVAVEFSWSAAPFKGSRAVTAVSADGIEADVDIASEAYRKLRSKLRRDSEESAGPRRRRKLEAARYSLTVRQGKDELLVIDGTSAELGSEEIVASANRMRVSKPGLASAAMSGVELRAVRGEHTQLRDLKVDEATFSITTPGLQKAVAKNPSASADADPDDEAAPTPSAPPATGSSARKATLEALMAKLTPDAQLELKRAHVEQVTGKTRVSILHDVACLLRVQSDGAVRITGRGATSARGSLDIDMRIWPIDLRADGRVKLAQLPLTLLVPFLPSVPWYEPENARIDASLLIKAESPARVALEGRAELRGVSLSAERIATVPVRDLSLSIGGRGHWLPLQRRLEIEQGNFGIGKARSDLKGAIELASDHFAFDIDAQLPATPCTDAVRSIPSELLGDMALAQWKGNIAGKLRLQTDSRELDSTVLKVDVTDRCDFQVVPVMADLSRFAEPFQHSVTEPDGAVFEMETGPGTDNWTPIEAMSPYFIHAVLVHEDPQFFNHKGFSLISIRNALVKDLHERRYVVGASTITMQLVKNIFLHREKTLARKLQEVLLTWWTERVMQKKDILELYLNVIEYGPSIYGVRNAAKHYWNRLPAELSPAEGVFLATILPNPKHYHTYFQRNAVPSSWLSNMRKNLQRELERGSIDQAAYDYSQQELEHFKFARDAAPPPPRMIPGIAAPLPYQETQETFETRTVGSRPDGFD